MKKRMRTRYVLKNGVRGDCPEWARRCREAGQEVTEERVMWLGNPWTCPCCAYSHN